MPTADIEHPAQDAAAWLKGENKQLERISLEPEGMELCKLSFSQTSIETKPYFIVSAAPPPPSVAQSKAKFEMGKQFVSEEQRKREQMERMFAAAKSIEDNQEEKPKPVNPEDEEVAEDEWDD